MERGQAQGILKETYNMAADGKIHYIYLINVQTANNTTIVLSATLPNSNLCFIHGIEFHLYVSVCVCVCRGLKCNFSHNESVPTGLKTIMLNACKF
jgi:hypothetical protein